MKRLTLTELVKVKGFNALAPKTINSHIDAFHHFFDWAERHRQLFEGKKVPKTKEVETDRKPFSNDQAHLGFTGLTENSSGLVRKESHKWAALIGLVTGARLNGICQLEVGDIQQEGDIWFLNITDEGENNKRGLMWSVQLVGRVAAFG